MDAAAIDSNRIRDIGTERPIRLPERLTCCHLQHLASSGHWHLADDRWLPRRHRARPSVALDDSKEDGATTHNCQARHIVCAMQSDGGNVWLERRVLHYAHQGGAREAPSSTMFAFAAARAAGATAFEMDVHRTLDGVLVVCHDESVDRTTSHQGRIDQRTMAELDDMDNAYYWSPGYDSITDLADSEYHLRGRAPHDRSLGIARLTEVLDAYPDMFLNFDIKGSEPETVGYEQQLADILRAYGRSDDVIVASFLDGALDRFRRAAPEIHTSFALNDALATAGALLRNESIAPAPNQVALQIPYRIGSTTLFDATFVERAHERGIAVHVWTIDDPTDMADLLEMGVDGLITDVPTVATDVIGARRYVP
jgi:glycerophosphoryl diester phosphodiesterase